MEKQTNNFMLFLAFLFVGAILATLDAPQRQHPVIPAHVDFPVFVIPKLSEATPIADLPQVVVVAPEPYIHPPIPDTFVGPINPHMPMSKAILQDGFEWITN